nr:HD domain-containing protein [uncultured Agathobaculum sp.]
MIDIAKLATLAVKYDIGDPRRVQHLMKVYAFCRVIGQGEGLDARGQNILEAAAMLHDIGIHEAERRHGSSNGKWQEIEGPAVAAPLLRQAGADAAECERVLWLIAHHHTYDASDEMDFRILVEADFLVNAYEDALPQDVCRAAGERVFRTVTGQSFLQNMYLSTPYQP